MDDTLPPGSSSLPFRPPLRIINLPPNSPPLTQFRGDLGRDKPLFCQGGIRVRVVLSAVLTGFLLLLLAGCKSTTQAPGGAAVTDQQQQGMQDILNYMKEKDNSL